MFGSPVDLQRTRQGHERVNGVELFFDQVFVFSGITQLSHNLINKHLTPMGAVETGLLYLAVRLVWTYTCWLTNWIDPGEASSGSCCWC